MHWFTKQASSTGYDDEHEESARLLGSAKTGVTRRASAYESYA